MGDIDRQVEYGWGARPISEQFKGEIPTEILEHYAKDAEDVLRLHIRGLLTDGERSRAINKLTKKIAASLSHYAVQPDGAPQ